MGWASDAPVLGEKLIEGVRDKRESVLHEAGRRGTSSPKEMEWKGGSDTRDFGLTRRRTFCPGHIEVTMHAHALQVPVGGSAAAARGAHS